jgi:hypothetical protein
MNSAASSSLNDVCYEQISENFHYGIFGDFHLVIDKDTGCFNATKLCAMSGKDFSDWKVLVKTKRLLSYLQEQSEAGKELVYEVRTSNNKGMEKYFTGQYVQKELILDIASWLSPEFYFRCNNIVIDYFTTEYKGLGEAEKTLFVRIRDSLKRKGVEFSSCKISIRDSTTVSEGELIETMKQINDEKLQV